MTQSFDESESTQPKTLSYSEYGARFEQRKSDFSLFRSASLPILLIILIPLFYDIKIIVYAKLHI